jgi:hypothetical protein
MGRIPARFPAKLPEFFIRFLTDPGDVVLDIFAGSNTTGQVAEVEDRRWLGFEERLDYVAASVFRFIPKDSDPQKLREAYARVNAGETVAIPPHAPHMVEALEDSVAVDLFSPIREDWIRGDDAYLRGQAACLFGTLAPPTDENAALLREVLLNSSSECRNRFLTDLNNYRPVASSAVAEMIVPSLIAILEADDINPKVAANHVQLSLRALNNLTREKAALAAIPALTKGLRGKLPVCAVVDRHVFVETLGRFGPAAAEALPDLRELLRYQGKTPVRADIQLAIHSIEGKKTE